MLLTVLDLRGVTTGFDERLPRPDDAGADVRDVVAKILARVRADGDAALRELTVQFDGVALDELVVPAGEVAAALARCPADLRRALEVAAERIRAYHELEAPALPDFADGGVVVRHLVRPVERAGCYAPGGRARYPSTVLMCAVPGPGGRGRVGGPLRPARPRRPGRRRRPGRGRHGRGRRGLPGRRGPGHRRHGLRDRVDPPGWTWSWGRATATWPRPSARSRGWSGVASAFAGPSEVVVVAGPDTPAALAAVDLVVQAEHGPDGLAWLVTWSAEKATAIAEAVETAGGGVAPAGRPARPPSPRAATPAWSTGRRRRSPWPTWSPPSTSS